jgi:hypothetical protein
MDQKTQNLMQTMATMKLVIHHDQKHKEHSGRLYSIGMGGQVATLMLDKIKLHTLQSDLFT